MTEYDHLSNDFTLRGAIQELLDVFGVFDFIIVLNNVLSDINHNADDFRNRASIEMNFPPKPTSGEVEIEIQKIRNNDD